MIIELIQHELLEVPATVYNFEVEDFHTYYVTASSILVHNTCAKFINRTTKDYWKDYNKLSKNLQKTADKQFELFKTTPNHKNLNFEKLKGFDNLYSVRINNQYRAIGEKVGDTITWTKIIPHT